MKVKSKEFRLIEKGVKRESRGRRKRETVISFEGLFISLMKNNLKLL